MLCVDFDHLNNVEALFNQLLQDEYFDTQLLFRSPSGDGLKWIISIDTAETTHSENLNEREQNKAEYEEYQHQLTEYAITKDKTDRERPQELPLRMLIIPTNNSATGLF